MYNTNLPENNYYFLIILLKYLMHRLDRSNNFIYDNFKSPARHKTNANCGNLVSNKVERKNDK